ncbi:DUF937 domain-containing protein [Hymenobacter arizonensis]|uniref:Uncharacterized protein n=1 Tax=Hymenobacter arizonensis TaxID=1227077 RepID=A0A1I5T2T5_HYMAR|nr:DUF937 domain-containing protein [Hymenobacter arizonensis]SFP77151.1 protein of unknown function [Hymenobacter arizonensis]
MINFFATLQDAFSQELMGHVAARLGERKSAIGEALGGLVPLVLAGLIEKAKSGGAQEVFDLGQCVAGQARGTYGSVTGILGVVGGGTAAGSALLQGEALVDMLFGASSGAVITTVGQYAGVKPESAGVLVRLVGAVLPALMGQHVAHRNLDARAAAVWLAAMQSRVWGMLPAALHGLTGILWPSELRKAEPINGGFSGVASPRGFTALAAFAVCVFLVSCCLVLKTGEAAENTGRVAPVVTQADQATTMDWYLPRAIEGTGPLFPEELSWQ